MRSKEIRTADLRCGPLPSADLAKATNRIAPKLKRVMTKRKLAPERVCFVTGWFRSGTTWVSHLIGAHPEAYWLGETNLANSLLPCLGDALLAWKGGKYAWPIGWTEPDWADLAGALRGTFSAIHRRFSTRLDHLLVEKSPGNTRFAPFLSAVWPEAAFVHVLRDPRDVIVSSWRTAGHADHAKWQSFEDYARNAGRMWCAGERAVAALKAMGTVPHTIRYEELFADPTAGTARLYDFLGLQWTPGLLAEAVRANSFEVVSGGRKPGEEDIRVHARQGLPGDWQRHMTASLSAEILDRAAPFWQPPTRGDHPG
jgi:hypothetical protein